MNLRISATAISATALEMDKLKILPYSQEFINGNSTFPIQTNLSLILYPTIQTLNNPNEDSFGKYCGKRKK